MANEVISGVTSPERDESDRKTTVLRRFLRDLFDQNVDRQILSGRRLDRAESVKQILSKRHTDVIQKSVELAAAKNLPVEANFEHRHEVKGEAAATDTPPPKLKAQPGTNSKSKSASKPESAETKAQKQRARQAAQKFVEPVTTLPLVSVNPSLKKLAPTNLAATRQPSSNYRLALRRSVMAAIVVGVVIVLIYVVS